MLKIVALCVSDERAGPNETRTCGIEDPSLWVDRHGIIHAVVHNWKAGGHAASADRGCVFGAICPESVIRWKIPGLHDCR